MADPPNGPNHDPSAEHTIVALEVHFYTQPHPAWVAGEVVETAYGVVQRIRGPALLGEIKDVIAVAVPLLGPNESDAIRGRRSSGLVDPGAAASPRIGGTVEGEVDRPVIVQHAGLVSLVGVVGAVRREVGLLLRGVVDVVGGGEHLDDVLEVQEVPRLQIAGEVQPAE